MTDKGQKCVMSPSKGQGQGRPRNKPQNAGPCYICGKPDRIACDPKCPAGNEVCRKCDMIGHYATMCKTKQVRSRHNKGKTVSKVSQNRDTQSSDDEYMFGVNINEEGKQNNQELL